MRTFHDLVTPLEYNLKNSKVRARDLAASQHITFTTQQLCSDSPLIFWNLRAGRAAGRARTITFGPWDPWGHYRNRFWCMFVYWELHYVNARQVVGGLAERPCALEIVKDTGGLCYLFVHLEFPYVVRGSVVLQCYAGPGTNQEEASSWWCVCLHNKC